jgi:DNA-binding transcriptional regulator GbsR (MarR family)
VNFNYDPEIDRMAGKCRACKERDTYEAKLNKFLQIRSQKVKHYEREVDWEAVIILEVKRMRTMSQGDFDEEVRDRTEALNEKRRIRKLDKAQAEREIAMMEATINRWVPPTTGFIQARPPHGSQSFRR